MYLRKYNPTGAGAIGKWRPEYEREAYKLALLGALEKDLADWFEVDTTTITYWKQTNPVFARALKKGKAGANMDVAFSFFKLATGFTHPDIHILSNRVRTYNVDTREVTEYTEPLIVPIVKYYPPSAFAAQKWLAIREREKWADVQQTQLTVSVEGHIDIEQVKENLSNTALYTTEELEWALKMGLPAAAFQNVTGN